MRGILCATDTPTAGGVRLEHTVELSAAVFAYTDAYTLFVVLPRVSHMFANIVAQTDARVFAPHRMCSRPDLLRMSASNMLNTMRRVRSIREVDLSHCLFQDSEDLRYLAMPSRI